MEGPSLRSVPARPTGPVDPGAALALVEERLPDLAPDARGALALVDLVGKPRPLAAQELGLDPDQLGALLAQARKALRRTLAALPSDGWCERAERLISDRMDGTLAGRGAARLDAHTRGCERCDRHERTLVQAHDLLVEALAVPALPSLPRTAELKLVREEAIAVPEPASAALLRRLALAIALLLVIAAAVLALLHAIP
jgi:hypothetical protein